MHRPAPVAMVPAGAEVHHAQEPLRETAQKTQYAAALVDGVLGLLELDERVSTHRIEPFSCAKTSALDLPYVRRD